MTDRAPPMVLASSHLGETRHVCAFFGTDEEEYRVLLPFMKDGFDCGERAIHIVNPDDRAAHLRRLSGAGIDTSSSEERGQLVLRTNTETYLRDGRFDQDRMLEAFSGIAGGDAERGMPRSRIICRMDWASASRALIDEVIEFESRVNDLWRLHEDAVICTYRLQRLSGDAVIDILRTHPMVIIGGILRRNPFFTPPEQFLPELRKRRKEQSSPHQTEA